MVDAAPEATSSTSGASHDTHGLFDAIAIDKGGTFCQGKLLGRLRIDLTHHVKDRVLVHLVGEINHGNDLVGSDRLNAIFQAGRLGGGPKLPDPLSCELATADGQVNRLGRDCANASNRADRRHFSHAFDDLADHRDRGQVATLGVGADIQSLELVVHCDDVGTLIITDRVVTQSDCLVGNTDPGVNGSLFLRLGDLGRGPCGELPGRCDRTFHPAA